MRTLLLAGLLTLIGSHTGLAQHAESVPLGSDQDGCGLCHALHGRGDGADVEQYMLRIPRNLDAYDSRASGASNPGAASASCLACHESPAGRENAMRNREGLPLPSGRAESFLGPDLADDHPVGRGFEVGLSAESGARASSGLPRPAVSTLVGAGAQDEPVRCSSCHDPHARPGEQEFSAAGVSEELCGQCHAPAAYAVGGHETVECLACHRMHGGSRPALINEFDAELLCRSCHDAGAQMSDGVMGGFESIAGMPEHDRPPGDDCLACHPAHSD